MKVNKLQNFSTAARDYTPARVMSNTANTVNYSSAPTFTGGGISFVDKFFPLNISNATKRLLGYFPNGERTAYEWMSRLGTWAKGEAAGIGITAIGTGLVAPWPIAFNPIVNHKLKKNNATPEEIEEKHKTQKYSAWRQPVSAILAVIFQLGVQKPIESALRYATNNEDTWFKGVYNQAFLNDEKYIEDVVKSEKAFKGKPKAEIKAEVGRRLDEQVDNVINAIKKVKETDAEIKIGKHVLPTDALAQALNNKLEDYISSAENLKKSDIPNTPKNIDFYVGRATELTENETLLRQLLSPENLEANINLYMSNNPKLDRPNAIRAYITDMKKMYKGNNAGMVNILDHILSKQDRVIESSCARNLERIDKVKKCCVDEHGQYVFSSERYRTYLKERNQIVDSRIQQLRELLTNPEDWKNAKPIDIKSKLDKIVEICHYDRSNKKLDSLFRDKGIFLANKKDLVKKVFDDLVRKGYREVVSNQYKIFSQITKASVASFIMLPITCTALNWVYPRFMELVCPNLAGVKKDKTPQVENKNGGDK